MRPTSSARRRHPRTSMWTSRVRLLVEPLEARTLLHGALSTLPHLLAASSPVLRALARHGLVVPPSTPALLPAGFTLGQQGGPAGPGPGPRYPNVRVNDPTVDTTTQDTQSETALVAADGIVVSAFNDSGGYRPGTVEKFTGWARSEDGGESFVDLGSLPSLPGGGDGGDPVLARDNVTGRIYLATLSLEGFRLDRVQLFRSDDGGATFQPPVNAMPGRPGSPFLDKEWITVDNFDGPGQGNVYVVAREFGSSNPGIYLTRSTDGGSTWGPSGGQLIVTAAGGNVQGAWVTVGSDHAVHAFWFDDRSRPQRLLMRTSTDEGQTFGPEKVVHVLSTTGVNGDLGLGGFRSNAFLQAVANPASGHLYVAYTDNPDGADRADVFFKVSNDNGSTWSDPQRVNDDATTRDNWQPALAVSPNGAKVGVFWYDRRLDAGNTLIDRYGALGNVSGNKVLFGENFRISEESFPPAFGRDPVVNPSYMGDYDQAAADGGFFYTTWGDNRDRSIGDPGRFNSNVRMAKIPVEVAGPIVVRSTPSGSLFGPVSSLRVTFDVEIDLSTFTLKDIVSFTGPLGDIKVKSVAVVKGTDNKVFEITFAAQTGTGRYSLVLGPDILDLKGRAMDQDGDQTAGETPDDRYTARFGLEGPRVSGSTPSGAFFEPARTARVTFNTPMDPATFTVKDVASFQGPGGDILIKSVTEVAKSGGRQFDITFAEQADYGEYTMMIGPDILDLNGNAMDQNNNLIPGEVPGDQFALRFRILDPCAGYDGFGYSACGLAFEDSSIAKQPGTFTIMNATDDEFRMVDLRTNQFSFYGVTYTGINRLYVNSNGLVTFNSGTAALGGTDLVSDPAMPAIAVLWTDWIRRTGPMVLGRFEDLDGDGTDDRLVVEWNEVEHYPSSSGRVTFQVILYLNTGAESYFTFNYFGLDTGDSHSQGATSTVGIKATNPTGVNRLLVSNRQPSLYVRSNQALFFYAPGPGNGPEPGTDGRTQVGMALVASLEMARRAEQPTELGELVLPAVWTPVADPLDPAGTVLDEAGLEQVFAAAAADQTPVADAWWADVLDTERLLF